MRRDVEVRMVWLGRAGIAILLVGNTHIVCSGLPTGITIISRILHQINHLIKQIETARLLFGVALLWADICKVDYGWMVDAVAYDTFMS